MLAARPMRQGPRGEEKGQAMFKALIIDKAQDGSITQSIEQIAENRLPEGDVLVDVAFSTLNYKDGLCLTGGGGLVRTYP
ncbi:MAG: oxidoreductase, partial [Rhodobacterales bacterium CG18_big_fil_WC_8_21_14_2_50_71_9]